MRIWQGLESIAPPFPASSVAIGVFDGVHLGHKALIHAARADALRHGRPSAVFTFDRHPAEVIAPSRAPGYLSTPAQRCAMIEGLGVDHMVVARFDEALRHMPARQFLADVLSARLGARAVVVGEDFRFGRGHAGTVETLRAHESDLGYALTVIPPVVVDGEKVSSSRVRELVASGDVAKARRMLGRAYSLAGTVVEGDRLGRQLGYPTANLELAVRQVVPADGVYAGWGRQGGQCYPAAVSIGMRPTVDGRRRVIEAYLIGFEGDIYGMALDIEFAAHVREQRRFASLADLTDQMALDVIEVERALAAAEGGTGGGH